MPSEPANPEPPSSDGLPARPSRAGDVRVRRWVDGVDAIEPITAMLHRAYAKQVEMGLKPLAGRQDDAVTKRRCTSGECFIAEHDGRTVGIIILNEIEPDEGPPWFRRSGVASFSQLAVDPSVQGRGVGQMLLEAVESRAREQGQVEIGLSMAEPDSGLRDFYRNRGYRIIATWKWPYTNYTSLIMSKRLRPAIEDGGEAK